MEEIKFRTHSIYEIINRVKTTSFQATNIEFVCLQIRKILEHIALANLVANKHHFEAQKAKFEKFWKAKLILEDIGKLNPNFYPKPIAEVDDPDPRIKKRLLDIKDGYLSKTDFVDVYNKCSELIHARNPYLPRLDYGQFERDIPDWMLKIKTLLNSHVIRLVNSENLYIIHMTESRDDKAHGYLFAKTTDFKKDP